MARHDNFEPALYQIVNGRGRVVNGVWNGKTPMPLRAARRKIRLMTAQGRGCYHVRRFTRPPAASQRSR